MSERAVVDERTVKRWFFRGKGYGSRRAVYMKIAKAMLYAELMGIECCCKGAGCDDCAEERYSVKPEDWRAAYCEKFPLDKCPFLTTEYRWDSPCEGHGREFCRCQYDAWLNAKIRELSSSNFGLAKVTTA